MTCSTPHWRQPPKTVSFRTRKTWDRSTGRSRGFGGVDATFGGIGINGHIAFNEPPEPGEECSLEAFADRPTRVLSVARETRAINSVTVGGELSAVPRRCITVGMREILASRRSRASYCNRPWQPGVVRRALHGPLTPPASIVLSHPRERCADDCRVRRRKARHPAAVMAHTRGIGTRGGFIQSGRNATPRSARYRLPVWSVVAFVVQQPPPDSSVLQRRNSHVVRTSPEQARLGRLP